jgi:hypothetical protein
MGLKERVETSLNESKGARDLLLSELVSATELLERKVAEAEERLKTTNRVSLAEQADLLKELDDNTRANAETALEARELVLERAEDLGRLLNTLRDELQSETRTRLSGTEELMEARLQTIEQQAEKKLQSTIGNLNSEFQENTQNLSEIAASHERLIREEINSFKEEMRRSLSEHQQSIDCQLTGFLNKQNALIQNLAQQIDSYQRVSQTLSVDLQSTKTQINELTLTFSNHKVATSNGVASLTEELNNLRALLNAARDQQALHDQMVNELGSSLQALSERLEKTIQKLKEQPLLGNRFKDL